jgi:peroxiredoxin
MLKNTQQKNRSGNRSVAISELRRSAKKLPVCATLAGILALSACTADTTPGVAASPDAVRPKMIGQSAPAFDLRQADGSRYEFAADSLAAPVIIVFYRGGWCPYCAAHFMELRKAEDAVREMGYELLFISPDQPEKLAESLTQLDVDYTLLSDSDMEAAKAFGIAFKVDEATINRYREIGIDLADSSGREHGLLPVPALFIIGTNGVIRFQYVNPNYKVRISEALLVAAATAALEQKPLKPLKK